MVDDHQDDFDELPDEPLPEEPGTALVPVEAVPELESDPEPEPEPAEPPLWDQLLHDMSPQARLLRQGQTPDLLAPSDQLAAQLTPESQRLLAAHTMHVVRMSEPAKRWWLVLCQDGEAPELSDYDTVEQVAARLREWRPASDQSWAVVIEGQRALFSQGPAVFLYPAADKPVWLSGPHEPPNEPKLVDTGLWFSAVEAFRERWASRGVDIDDA